MFDIGIYTFCGILSGLFSGMLGIGGGLVVVPLLLIIFEANPQIPPHHIMHIIVATSLSASIFTSLSSAIAQTKHKAVMWNLVKIMSPFIIIGTIVGASLSTFFSATFMRWILIFFLVSVGTQILFDLSPQKSQKEFSNLFYQISAFIIGVFSSFVGLAGGSIFVPFLKYTLGNMRNAIGTSTALAWSLALSGGIGYIIAGYNVTDLPKNMIGYIHIPALICIAISSMLVAPFGVKLSHSLPINLLKKIFAILLFASAIRTFMGIVH